MILKRGKVHDRKVSEAATNIGNAQRPVSRGDCANGFGPKERPHFRLQHPSRTDPILHPARKNEAESSDALIVKAYAMSASKTRLTA